MARITFSPLVIAASGKVGDTVFSKWKGRAYIRSRVTPANPKTAAQTTQREKLQYAVAHWQALPQDIKDRWGEYASPYSMSGYNKWCNSNIKPMLHALDLSPVITPPNKDVAGPTDWAAVPGAASGEIDVTWLEGKEGALIYIEAFVMKEGTLYYIDPITQESHEAVLASVHALTITGLTPGAVYAVLGCTADSNLSDNLFSQGYTTINVTATA